MEGLPPTKKPKVSDTSSEFGDSDDEDLEVQATLPRAGLCPQRLHGLRMKLVQRVNEDYFAMLRDVNRNDFYWDAMKKLPVRNRRVLDLGAGTGILSLMAAKLGASSVLAVDESPEMTLIVEKSAEHNGFKDTISVHAGHSTTLSLAEKDRCDVIVSETFGVLLLQEGCLKSFIHAREHLAKPSADIIPAGGVQYARLMGSPALRLASSISSAEGPDMVHVDALRDAGRVQFSLPGGFSVNSLPDVCWMSESIGILEVDFATSKLDDIPKCREFPVRILQDGVVDGIVTSWETWSDKERTLCMSTEADKIKGQPWGFARDAHWGQGFSQVEGPGKGGEKFEVFKGEELRLQARFTQDGESLQLRLFRPEQITQADDTGDTGMQLEKGGTEELKDGAIVPCTDCKPATWLRHAARPVLCDAVGPANPDLQTAYEADLPSNFVCSERLRGKKSLVIRTINDDYFAFLNNPARLRFFRNALPGLVKNKTVLDLGTGAGQLAVLCAHMGARHVLAMDACSDMCDLARETARRNKVTGIVQVAHFLSSSLALIGEDSRMDVLVSEPYDLFITEPSGSGSLEYFIDARRRLVKPNATLIPSGGAQYARLVMSADLGMRSVSMTNSSKVGLDNLCGFLDTVTLTSSRTRGFRWSCLPDLAFMSDRCCIFKLDFYQLKRSSIPRKTVLQMEVVRDGYVDAIATSWEVWAGSAAQHRFSAHAEETENEAWGFNSDVVFGQGLQLVVEEGDRPEPFHVKQGEVLELTALHFTLRRGAGMSAASGNRAFACLPGAKLRRRKGETCCEIL